MAKSVAVPASSLRHPTRTSVLGHQRFDSGDSRRCPDNCPGHRNPCRPGCGVFLVHRPLFGERHLLGPMVGYQRDRAPEYWNPMGAAPREQDFLSESHRYRPRIHNPLQHRLRRIRKRNHARRRGGPVHLGPQAPFSIDPLDLLLASNDRHVVVRSGGEHPLGLSDGLVPPHVGTGCRSVFPRPPLFDWARLDRSDSRGCRRELHFVAGVVDLACGACAPVASAPLQRSAARLGRLCRYGWRRVLHSVRNSRRRETTTPTRSLIPSRLSNSFFPS